MTLDENIAEIGALQAQMIAALEGQDVAAIEQACAALARASGKLRTHGAVHNNAETLQRLNHVLRQNDATKTRLAFLAERNRQKIDALAEIRSGSEAHRYIKP